jgi:hypothetical protein
MAVSYELQIARDRGQVLVACQRAGFWREFCDRGQSAAWHAGRQRRRPQGPDPKRPLLSWPGRGSPAAADREYAVRQAEIRRVALALARSGAQLKDNRAQLLGIVEDLAPGLTSTGAAITSLGQQPACLRRTVRRSTPSWVGSAARPPAWRAAAHKASCSARVIRRSARVIGSCCRACRRVPLILAAFGG